MVSLVGTELTKFLRTTHDEAKGEVHRFITSRPRTTKCIVFVRVALSTLTMFLLGRKATSMNVKLSTKGQLIIPGPIRQRHGWNAGAELVIEDRGDHLVIRSAKEVPRTELKDVIGCVGYRGPQLSLEEMEAGIARGARRTG